MTIQEQINIDLKEAMLSKNESVKSILRVLIGEMNRVDKVVSDEKVTSIIKKMCENAKMVGNLDEITILEKYLPKQLSEDDLKKIITALVAENSFTIKDMGKIMSSLKEKYNGQYDGKIASSLIKTLV